jgi:GT2 family glycosyltransferase
MQEGVIDISIIIINFNGMRYIDRLMQSIISSNNNGIVVETICVDNASSDDSSDYVSKQYPWVKLIKSNQNLGFGGGVNLGIKSSQGQYILLLNNDGYLDRNCIYNLYKSIRENNFGAVVPKVVLTDSGKIDSAGCVWQTTPLWPILQRGYDEIDDGQYNQEGEIEAWSANAILLSRNMLLDIGLFDDIYFMYFEDTDLCWRAKNAGYRFYYQPKAIFNHDHSGTAIEWSDFFTYYVISNRSLIQLKLGTMQKFYLTIRNSCREFFIVQMIRKDINFKTKVGKAILYAKIIGRITINSIKFMYRRSPEYQEQVL